MKFFKFKNSEKLPLVIPNGIIFSSNRKIYNNGGVFSINDNLIINEAPENLTLDETIELCNLMIKRWKNLKSFYVLNKGK